jgi:acyl-CoA reductase-like NAD-dependent aldehyde dehydrogenase
MSSCWATDGRTLLIDGVWRGASKTMPVLNPYSGEIICCVACADPAHVEAVISSARRGLARNRNLATGVRSELLRKVAMLVAARREEFAHCISGECGKPIEAARKEVDRCVNTLTLSSEEATRVVGETINFDSFGDGQDRSGYFFYEPIGIVLAITPFNDPLNLVAHKLGPAIAAGNSVVLKPSEQAPLSALKLVKAFVEAGLPDGVISVLTGYGKDFGEQLVASPDVALVSFTGGERAGEAIAKSAGIKKLVMELGANSPVIVTKDCNLAAAVEACVSGAFWASGQNCIGVQRIYVQEPCYQAFVDAFVKCAQALKVGDQLREDTSVGPMISPAHVQRVANWVSRAIGQGGQLLCGGSVSKDQPSCFPPTVLGMANRTAEVVEEEVFGPVVSLHSYTELDQAITLANRPDYMIHAAIFTDKLQSAIHASRALNCAGVLINDSTDYRLDAMPFGGAKRGAMGREGVKFAIREMVQTKTVCMNLAS